MLWVFLKFFYRQYIIDFTSFMGLFCPVFWEKYSTYHPCVFIVISQSLFKEMVVDNIKVELRMKILTNVYQKKLVLSHYFAPLLFKSGQTS